MGCVFRGGEGGALALARTPAAVGSVLIEPHNSSVPCGCVRVRPAPRAPRMAELPVVCYG